MKISIILMALLAIIVAVCSYFQMAFVPYLVTATVVSVIILVFLKKIPQNCYPVYLVGLSLIMIWSQTMLGSYIVGTDIHQELYMANKTIAEGWDWSYYFLNGTSILLNVIVPILDKVGIPVVWQFKILYPIVLAFVPLVLYIAFSKQISKQWSFYAVIFFIIVPVFTVEIATINKSMVAELFFALVVLTLFSNLKHWKKFVLLSIYGILAAMCHYTVGTLVFGYLAITGIVLLVYGILKRKLNFVPVVSAVVIIGIVGGLWFYYTGGGMVYLGYSHAYETISNSIVDTSTRPPKDLSSDGDGTSIGVDEASKVPNIIKKFINPHDSLLRTALGFDFDKASLSGKLFRIIQYITQLAIILGFIFLVWKRKKYKLSIECIAGILASVVILGMVVLIPNMVCLINTTRWYHSALFFASPLFVIGLVQIGKERLVAIVLVIYYLFTSGFIFAITQDKIPSKVIEVPYSISYSGDMGLTGFFNDDDVACAEWLQYNIGDKKVQAGFNDMFLLIGYIAYDFQFDEVAPKEPHYLFISTQNIKLQKISVWTEIGMRKLVDLPDTTGMVEVFRKGEAVVYYGN